MSELDKFIEDGSARYVAAKTEGQQIIRRRWGSLVPETKSALVASGFYSERGERLDIESPETSLPQHNAERLEHALGLFKHCLAAKLPALTKKKAPIPVEAHTDEVLSAVGELLYVSEWHDPDFLRLALGAAAQHQRANALSMHTPQSTLAPAWGCVGATFKMALFLALPVALAAGIAAATRQDVGGASLAFYIVGFGVLAVMSSLGIGVGKKDGFELAYGHWTRFQLNGAAGVNGAGALESLRRMAHDGVNVPSVAFDVAETLRSRMAGGR